MTPENSEETNSDSEMMSEEMDTPTKKVSANKTQKSKKRDGSKNKKKMGSKTQKKTSQKKTKTTGPKKGGGNQKAARYFKMLNPKTGESSGRYTGDTPKQAASKGFTKMVQRMNSDGKKIPHQSTIYLRESTRNSSRKIYGYVATRQKLPVPQKLKITDKVTGEKKVIIYYYRNKIHKVSVPELIGGYRVTKQQKKKVTKKNTESGKSKSKTDNKNKTITKKTLSKKKSDNSKSKTVSAKVSR